MIMVATAMGSLIFGPLLRKAWRSAGRQINVWRKIPPPQGPVTYSPRFVVLLAKGINLMARMVRAWRKKGV